MLRKYDPAETVDLAQDFDADGRPVPSPADPDRCHCGAPVSPEYGYCGYCDDCLARLADEWDEYVQREAEARLDADHRQGPIHWAD
jgi:hypothetical protein